MKTIWGELLELQTQFLAPYEMKWLNKHHALNNDVLEIGSGTGFYGANLARHCPDQSFWGLEASADFTNGSSDVPKNYRMEKCRVGVDPFPLGLTDRFATCLIRFVLQHDSDPLRVLSCLYDNLPSGGRIFIIEEDDRLFLSNGKYPPWDAAANIWKRTCRFGGTNSQIGLELPMLIERAGFALEDFNVEMRSSINEPGIFFDFFKCVMRMLCQSMPEVVTEEEFAFVIEGLSRMPPKGFCAIYPQVMAVAIKR
ncbi:class I SAM-dependent methyltransferase [Pseudomonas putida]